MNYVYGAALLLLLSLAAFVGYTFGNKGKSEAQVKLAQVQQQYAQASADASEKARKIEQQKAEAINEIAQSYEKGKQDAQSKADAVVAGLQSGNLKLRKLWAGCETDSLSDSAASASQSDAGAAERNKSAADLVRIAADADAQIRGLQAVVTEDRK